MSDESPVGPGEDPFPVDDDEDVRRLAVEGRTVEAIKLLRERRGIGLKEAKDAVDALRREAPGGSSPVPHGIDDPAVRAQIEDEIRAGRTIHAIRIYREHSTAGLKEAKDAIDGWRAELGLEPVRSGCFIAIFPWIER